MAKKKDTAGKDLRGEALATVAQAALAMPGKSRAGKILKGAVAGAAIGGQFGLAFEKWRGSKKGGRAKLSQEAVSKPHAKTKPKKTKKKEESV